MPAELHLLRGRRSRGGQFRLSLLDSFVKADVGGEGKHQGITGKHGAASNGGSQAVAMAGELLYWERARERGRAAREREERKGARERDGAGSLSLHRRAATTVAISSPDRRAGHCQAAACLNGGRGSLGNGGLGLGGLRLGGKGRRDWPEMAQFGLETFFFQGTFSDFVFSKPFANLVAILKLFENSNLLKIFRCSRNL
jgi:hypothetical protein